VNETSLLTVRNVHKSFGNLKALNGVDMEVEPNSITGLIGPNGSGKSTLFNVITGFYEKDEGQGEILFGEDRIDDLRPARIADKGVQRTFQITQATRKMTVMENMLLSSSISRALVSCSFSLAFTARGRKREWKSFSPG